MGNHRNEKYKEIVGKTIGNQIVQELIYNKGKCHYKVYCCSCETERMVKPSDFNISEKEYCNNCFSFDKFKKDFFKKFPNSNLKLLKKNKSKILLKDSFGYCRIEFRNLMKNGNTSIVNAISPTNYFINRIKSIITEKLDYSDVIYKDVRTKVKLKCKKHGSFLAKIDNLNQGIGCFKCKREREDVEETKRFIEKAKKIHGNTYSYKNCKFHRAVEKVTITCKIHGDFKQLIHNHLKGNGCKRCASIATNNIFKNNYNLRSYSGWEKMGLKSKNFDSFKLYIIECYNESERFYKIGKTFISIKDRFVKCKFPYNWNLIKTVEGDALQISLLEKEIHLKNKEFSYTPLLRFKGEKECFRKVILNK